MRPLIFALTIILAQAGSDQQARNERMNEDIAQRLKRVLEQHPPTPRPDPRKK